MMIMMMMFNTRIVRIFCNTKNGKSRSHAAPEDGPGQRCFVPATGGLTSCFRKLPALRPPSGSGLSGSLKKGPRTSWIPLISCRPQGFEQFLCTEPVIIHAAQAKRCETSGISAVLVSLTILPVAVVVAAASLSHCRCHCTELAVVAVVVVVVVAAFFFWFLLWQIR